jgi:hypothetical protein
MATLLTTQNLPVFGRFQEPVSFFAHPVANGKLIVWPESGARTQPRTPWQHQGYVAVIGAELGEPQCPSLLRPFFAASCAEAKRAVRELAADARARQEAEYRGNTSVLPE